MVNFEPNHIKISSSRKKLLYFLWSFLFVLICFSSCEKETDNIPDDVKFNMIVTNDTGLALNGAKIYFFDSEAAYNTAVATKVFTSAVDSAVSVATGLVVNLDPGKEYWVYIEMFDIPNNVLLSNYTISGKLDKLEKSSELFTKFVIAPLTGNVSFWSDNVNKFPIKVKLGNMVNDTLFTSMATAPTAPNNPNALNFQVLGGTYSYYAIAANNCVWAGTVTVPKGGFVNVPLPTCYRGRISFYAPTYNPVHGPITVKLDNNEVVGVINAAGTFVCGSGSGPGTGTNYITVTKDANTYNYVARSADNLCSWTGTIVINPSTDQCDVVPLTFCP
ncbi:MAG: hypothetical protein K2X86_08415 [Cytophagaceae bacterium]|nr:hypothetical protein [Cytophagaceae bacterium]